MMASRRGQKTSRQPICAAVLQTILKQYFSLTKEEVEREVEREVEEGVEVEEGGGSREWKSWKRSSIASSLRPNWYCAITTPAKDSIAISDWTMTGRR